MTSRRGTCLTGNRTMVKSHSQKTVGIVTRLTWISCWNMAVPLPYSDGIVMTVGTHFGGLAVVKGHYHRRPQVGGMAGLAQIAG